MLVLALVLAVLVGVSLGLLGGGGSILTVPILVYVVGLEPRDALADRRLRHAQRLGGPGEASLSCDPSEHYDIVQVIHAA